ncbi:MAG: 3'(2'),5'-bisphosphate nucleotidase CysQ [Alphaproteobacteria bacterium]|nr:3'(2'),5'-bisphosphate nucleotidase CysQ [Alphaproteobacteria bacterium]
MTLDELAVLAREAGREIYAVWKAGFTVTTKLDGSPVTIADQRAEAIILAGLRQLAPDIPVIAEEESAAGRTPTIKRHFFLVDPLDGTKGFSEGKPDYTVNIGLIENNVPVAGVIYAPATGALYAGGYGEAWQSLCDPETADEIGPRTPLGVTNAKSGFVLVGSHSFDGPKFKAFANAIGASKTSSASSSLKFCKVAEGSADIYPRFGGLCEWDVAAGHAILRAAGGGVMRLDGSEIIYGRALEDFELDGVIAYGGAASERAARAAI